MQSVNKLQHRYGKKHKDIQGFTDYNSIYINVSELWGHTHDVDAFIDEFINTYIHESVHIVVRQNLEFAEEYAVRRLLKQPFPKDVHRLYK